MNIIIVVTLMCNTVYEQKSYTVKMTNELKLLRNLQNIYFKALNTRNTVYIIITLSREDDESMGCWTYK